MPCDGHASILTQYKCNNIVFKLFLQKFILFGLVRSQGINIWNFDFYINIFILILLYEVLNYISKGSVIIIMAYLVMRTQAMTNNENIVMYVLLQRDFIMIKYEILSLNLKWVSGILIQMILPFWK